MSYKPSTFTSSYSLKNDKWITYKSVNHNMIEGFIPEQIKQLTTEDENVIKVMSYGVTSYGYDLRIGEHFKLFSNSHHTILDPKKFDTKAYIDIHAKTDDEGCKYIVMPPHSFALGTSVERINMPDNVLAMLATKSSYARIGLLLNFTVIQPAFKGDITVELTNSTPFPIKVYANEGCGNLIFFEGNKPNEVYNGKYQNQSGVTEVI